MYKKWLPATTFMCLVFFQQPSAQTVAQYEAISDSHYYFTGRFDSAMKYARLAEPLIIDSFSVNSKEYAVFGGQYYSMIYEKLGNIDSAKYWYEYGFHLLESLHDTATFEYGEILSSYGSMLNDMGYYTEALPHLQKGVDVLSNHQDQVDSYLGSLNNLANNYNYCGDYFNAEALYQKCLTSLNNIKGLSDPTRKGIVQQNLATIYVKTGNLKDAEIYFKRTCETFKSPFTLLTYYEARKNLGALYIAMQKTGDAENIFTGLYNDETLNKHNGSNPKDNLTEEFIQAINGLGTVKEVQHKYTEAEKLYHQSMVIAEKINLPRGIVSSLGCLAHLYATTGRNQQADSVYEKLLAVFSVRNFIDRFSLISAYIQYCENLIMLKQMQKAAGQIQYIGEILFADLYKNFPGMNEETQMQYMLMMNRYKSLLPTTLAGISADKNSLITYSLNRLLQLKGMILTYQQKRRLALRSSSDTMLTIVQKKWQRTREILYRSYHRDTIAAPYIDSLEAKSKIYEQEIAFRTGVLPEAISDKLADKISDRLQPNEAAIEFVRYKQGKNGENRYGAFLMRHSRPPVFIELFAESSLMRYFKGVDKKSFSTLNQLSNSRMIYDMVWKPGTSYLKNIQKIYYSPDGLLNYISFDALSAGPGAYILNQKKLIQLMSLRSILKKPIGKYEITSAVLWGSIDCSEPAYLNQPSLTTYEPYSSIKGIADSLKGPTSIGFSPMTDDELPEIIKLVRQKKLSVKVYKNQNATEERFKQDAAGFKGLLHISSHGFYAMNPADTLLHRPVANSFVAQVNPLLRCGLILSGANYVWSGKAPLPGREDEILTGYEIAAMDLSKVKLVVLSACETGLGDLDAGSEGVLGLQRAFKMAGVDKMILSLWSVNTKFTEKLMTAFYTALLNGNNPAESLRLAKQEMAKKNPPYTWAGFVLVE